eukprot:282735-Pyramimonas_sp.AAC.1
MKSVRSVVVMSSPVCIWPGRDDSSQWSPSKFSLAGQWLKILGGHPSSGQRPSNWGDVIDERQIGLPSGRWQWGAVQQDRAPRCVGAFYREDQNGALAIGGHD